MGADRGFAGFILKGTVLASGSRVRYLIAYTLVFAVACAACFAVFLADDRTFIWRLDGFKQYCFGLAYLGKYLRSFARSLLAGNPALPLWDHSLGFGADVIGTLHYYGLGDPLCLLCAFAPVHYTELLYNVLVVLRLYLAGLAFSAFCARMRCSFAGALAGAIAYAFCGFALFGVVRHPFFGNALVYLPLLLLGAERIMNRESPVLFMCMVAVAAASNIYFFYMHVVFVALYVVVRSVVDLGVRTPKALGAQVARFLGYGCTGVLLAGVVLGPVVATFFSSARSAGGIQAPLYDPAYVAAFVGKMFSRAQVGNWMCVGFAAPVALGLFAVFGVGKSRRSLKIILVLLAAFALLPVAGYVLSGMSYVSNRWSFALAFAVCFAFASSFDDVVALSGRRLRMATVVVAAYVVVSLDVLAIFGGLDASVVVSYALLAAVVGVLWVLRVPDSEESVRDGAPSALSASGRLRARSWALVALTVVCVGVNGLFLYGTVGQRIADDYLSRGKAASIVENGTSRILKKQFAGQPGRLDRTMGIQWYLTESAYPLNESALANVSSTGYYWSLYSGDVVRFVQENGVNAEPACISGLDGRAYLQALSGVRYTIGADSRVPYGCEFVRDLPSDSEHDVRLFKNGKTLPFGYSYASCITRGQYDALDVVDKQSALLESALVEDDAAPDVSVAMEVGGVESDAVRPDAHVDYGEDVVLLDDGGIDVKKKGAKVVFTFDAVPNSETYLEVLGIEADYSRGGHVQISPWSSLYTEFTVGDGAGAESVFTYFSPESILSSDQRDFLALVGCSAEGVSRVEVAFSRPGIYRFESFGVVCKPMDGFDARVEALSERALEDVEMEVDRVSGSFAADEARLLCIPIPYSSGWTAVVDGVPADTIKVNGMFTGLLLQAGEHEIELVYRSPGLLAGAAMSVAGLVILAVLVARGRRALTAGRL